MSMGRQGRRSVRWGHVFMGLFFFLAIAVSALLASRSLVKWRGLPENFQATTLQPALDENDADLWYSVYFTNPSDMEARAFRDGPDAHLAEAIRQARLSVDLAVYELDLWSVRDALKAAHRNGVVVRAVTDSDNLEGPEIQALVEAGIPVAGDRRESLMHDKFVIIDRREVWTGSMNLTLSGAYENDNNLIRIRSPELAGNYLAEFEEMFAERRFGSGSPANTPKPVLWIDGARVETWFSPEDGTAKRLVELIRGAQQSVYFLAYSFTSDEIAGALLERSLAGVTIAGVLDESQARTNTGSEYERLLDHGLDVHLDGNPENMHHKVILIDEKVVVTGSYNFSASAEERNDENTLILDNPQIASLYLAEFERVLAEAKR
jgi:phosphatidylserine/phosphatidylglycerophosphate/cardiolipin synthase-like enzyme